MKDNLTIAQWAKVLGYKKLDEEWYKDITTGERVHRSALYNIQANTRIDFENKKIYMIAYYMEDALYYNQQVALCDFVGSDMIELIENWEALD